jgi:hypothetical protein
LGVQQVNTEKPQVQNIFGNTPLNNLNRPPDTIASLPQTGGVNLFASHIPNPTVDQNKLFQKDDTKNVNIKN